jgi:Spy/CpxP family protein refolding chaperone
MPDIEPELTFRGLPLTAEQDASIRHYIKQQRQHGQPVNDTELDAMLKDMLEPPGDDDEGAGAATDDARGDAERASASIDETMDAIGASEERNAAMESEAMKRQQR